MSLDLHGQHSLSKIAWHALPVEVIVALHITDLTNGLSDGDVEIRRSILSATLPPLAPTCLRSSSVYRMVRALSTAAASATPPFRKWIDHSRKTLLRVLNISRVSSLKNPIENARAILHTLSQRQARVMRNGVLIRLPPMELVLGDIILVEVGDVVPADGRLFLAQSLSSLELSLNGGATPAQKSTSQVAADAPLRIRSDMIYMGTQIATGSGRAIVVATGIGTEIGRRE